MPAISGWETDAKGRVLHVMDGHSGGGSISFGKLDHRPRSRASAAGPQAAEERLPPGLAMLVWLMLSVLLWLAIWPAVVLVAQLLGWRWLA